MSEAFNTEISKQELSNSLSNREKQKTAYSGIVYTGERSIAKGTDMVGRELPLAKFLSETGLNITESDEKYPIDKIYLRTETDNIYSIRYTPDKGGEIINAKTGIISPINGVDLRTNSPQTIRVGEPFYYQTQSEMENPQFLNTSKVVEFVAVSKVVKSDTEIQNMAKGKESSILKDFKNLRDNTKKV